MIYPLPLKAPHLSAVFWSYEMPLLFAKPTTRLTTCRPSPATTLYRVSNAADHSSRLALYSHRVRVIVRFVLASFFFVSALSLVSEAPRGVSRDEELGRWRRFAHQWVVHTGGSAIAQRKKICGLIVAACLTLVWLLMRRDRLGKFTGVHHCPHCADFASHGREWAYG